MSSAYPYPEPLNPWTRKSFLGPIWEQFREQFKERLREWFKEQFWEQLQKEFRGWFLETFFLVVTFLPLTNLVEVDELRIPIPGAAPPMDPEKVCILVKPCIPPKPPVVSKLFISNMLAWLRPKAWWWWPPKPAIKGPPKRPKGLIPKNSKRVGHKLFHSCKYYFYLVVWEKSLNIFPQKFVWNK